MPPSSTLRVDKSMKKSTRNRCSPLRVHTSTVKKSAATISFQCRARNSFQVVLRFRSGAGSIPCRSRMAAMVLRAVLVQTSNWPNLLRRYAGSELGGHHSGPDCGHGRRPVRQLADLELFLPDFRCQFNSADRHRRRIEALEAQHRSDPLFYTTVVLFDSVIEILARADTHSFGDRPRSLQLPNGTMRGRICIQRDDARRSVS